MKTSIKQHHPQADEDSLNRDRFEVRCVGCRSWFCGKCCVKKGIALREKLAPIVATFSGLVMLTFTIDPKQFSGPKEAHEYLKATRCIGRTMGTLKRRGLIEGRWFCVKEFQKRTKQTHFHVLVDSQFVPIEVVRAIWAGFVPKTYQRPEGDRSPAFGSVNFSAPKFNDASHAANYATKYLIKTPDEGWPEWVLESETAIVRYTTSRRFWGEPEEAQDEETEQATKSPKATSTLPRCEPTCFCEVCRGELDEHPKPAGTTIGYRVGTCCTKAALFRVQETIAEDGEIIEHVVFEQTLPEPAVFYRAVAGAKPDADRFPISLELVEAIFQADHQAGNQDDDGREPNHQAILQYKNKASPPTASGHLRKAVAA